MKTAEFDDLCRREHEQGGGVVVRLYLTEDSYAELRAEVAAGNPPEWAALELDAMANPATHTPVSIGRGVTKALFTDTAEVTRWVPVVSPIPPERGTDGLPPRNADGYTTGG